MNFFQRSLFSVFGKFLNAFFTLVISVVVARYLGVDGVGQYQILLSAQVVLITIFAMGFGNASVYFINSENISRKQLTSNLFRLFSLVSIIMSIVFAISIIHFVEYFGKIDFYAIVIFVSGTGALLLYNILMPTLYADLEVVKLQVLSLTPTIFLSMSFIMIEQLGKLNVNKAIAFYGISNLINLGILLYYLRRDIIFLKRSDKDLLKRLFLFGIKISAANLIFILSSNVVIFLIQYFLDDGFTAVGLFSRATAIANIFLLIPVTLGPLIYSKWSKTDLSALSKEIERALRTIIFVTTLSAVFTIIYGKTILIYLYGIEFVDAETSLIILAGSVILSSITIIFTNFFSSIGKPYITLKVFLTSLLTTTALAVFLIPKYSIEGAAVSILIGLIINVMLLVWFGKKEIELTLSETIIIKISDMRMIINALAQKKS
jgi:O-antigen/teichoic acid export membrane protein